jgi:hypothetical protein
MGVSLFVIRASPSRTGLGPCWFFGAAVEMELQLGYIYSVLGKCTPFSRVRGCFLPSLRALWGIFLVPQF